MNIKGFEIKACIFDLDGTILDSCSVWADVDRNFFRKRGREIPEGYAKAITPLGLEKSAEYTKKNYGIIESEEEIIREWLDDVSDAYHTKVEIKGHADKYLKYLKDNGLLLSIATANSKECYEPCLNRLDLFKYFEFACDVKMFTGGKNSPEIFLNCANKMGYKPEEILVFEDSLVALETAGCAGFKTCAVYEEACHDEILKEEIADIYIKDFEELMK